MLTTSFSPWPSFTQEEADAVSKVLLSNKVNYWTGTECREFEKEFAEWCNTKYAVALANGTLALDVALKVLGIKQGDDVIVTSRTFIASASCIVTAGANPVFADVDLNSQNITAESISSVLTPNTKAIIVVHLAGMPADMDSIMALAKQHNLFVIEDCAQAHGAKYKGQPVGSIGHIGAWSFCQDKIMTTGGEGGMVTTNDKGLWEDMWSYKDHGKSWTAIYEKQHPPGFRWVHDSIGTNWRMLEMQAVIGRIQLKKMADWTKIRTKNAERIWNTCQGFDFIRVPEIPEHICHAHYKCYVFINPEKLPSGWDRDRIISELNEKGTPCYQGSCSEVYMENAFANMRCVPEKRLANAKKLGETSLMFLVHPTLTEDDNNKLSKDLLSVLQEIARELK
ncbi:MAG: aminotransferase [Cellvibrio sp. 79]|nr:MAG: aminotransferase [Cellvibrio sp. 79]